MSEKQAVYSISICGRAILDMHSLNNEGGEGNQIATRMVNLVYKDKASGEYKLATVNAISGDMFKHIQAEHLYLIAKGNLPKLPLCAGCQKFSASRILDDKKFMDELPAKDSDVIDKLLKHCVLDDMEGNLIAKGARSVPRKSVAEFGWVVGVPEYTTTESYFHVRYAAERGERSEEAQQQAIFHRPASSGVYAIVANFEISRIGFNDISQQYPISDEEREKRYQALMRSILYTFIEPNGAMRGTQNPHIAGFEGVVTVTREVMPAPALSPLNEGYRMEIERVAAALNELNGGAVVVHQFDSMSQFADVMKDLLVNSKPYKLAWREHPCGSSLNTSR
ncbi:MAG TPA: DevR family CRISPR-associated autoregulator [Methanothrix sp.]|nr:DevR family CRISPR-associated autoregulator [Methanothrix sp.]HOK59019.1 DevR family CRISPR-associated autoregulator [Methanothrix sp.]HOL44364.1 DevR family CRISPR-associated autoregulator [Methanothrix sp.]HPO89278.1 DevR family CRISPR-associated autoregulator [Methanothrix sp.]